MKHLIQTICCVYIFTTTSLAQTPRNIKLDAVSVGTLFWDTEFKARTYPISFAPYFSEAPALPGWIPNATSFSSGAGFGWQWSGHIDAQWKLSGTSQSKWWRNARWQTGLFYTGHIVEGQTISLENYTTLPAGGSNSNYVGYQNSMQYRMLGVNIRWLQFLPVHKKGHFKLYTGIGFMHGWTFSNRIAQTEYNSQRVNSTSGEVISFTKQVNRLNDIKGRSFQMSRPQLPLGIQWRLNKRFSFDAEFNIATEWYTLKKRTNNKQEAHGFSFRIAHYF